MINTHERAWKLMNPPPIRVDIPPLPAAQTLPAKTQSVDGSVLERRLPNPRTGPLSPFLQRQDDMRARLLIHECGIIRHECMPLDQPSNEFGAGRQPSHEGI
jgi:hypothetical protein